MIINVTGGPDLSLVEVSEASCIVQEAADDDANIIFGAVVDSLLKNKVKITVIATGFGVQLPGRSASSTAQTPVDMTHYADHTRQRPDAMPAPPSVAGSRLSIARRALLDLPIAVSMPAGASAAPGAPGGSGDEAEADADTLRADEETAELAADPDFAISSTFDVPAFLRRQEG